MRPTIIALLCATMLSPQSLMRVQRRAVASAGLSFVSAGQNSAGSPCSVTKTLTAGDTLIIGVAINSSTQANLTTPTSSAADTSTIALIGSKQTQAFDAGSTMAIYKLPSATGGSETITETQGGGACGMVVLQFRGSALGAIDGTTIVNNGNVSVFTSICTPGTGGAACTSTFTPSGAGEAAITFSANEAFNNVNYVAGSVCGGTGTIPASGATSNTFMPIAGQYFLNCPASSTTSSMGLTGSGDRGMALTVLLQP